LDDIEISKLPPKERVFVIDDTNLAKCGKMIENVSYIYDHNVGRTILGFCIVTLGLFMPTGFYPLDVAYCFGKKRNPKSPLEKVGDPRSISGRMSYEAKHFTKLELALQMIQNAVHSGIVPGYVLFDSWYSWPVFINIISEQSAALSMWFVGSKTITSYMNTKESYTAFRSCTKELRIRLRKIQRQG